MILVCDLGNTNVVFGLYDNDKCMDSFRLVSSKLMALDEYIAKLNTIVKDKNIDVSGVEGCIMSSVMPSIATIIKDAIKSVFKVDVLMFGAGVKSGMSIQVDNPCEVGTDLIAACVGAVSKYGKPLLLVDFGTATKINVVDKNGAFVGCVIAPGLKISQEALVNVASQLPIISYEAPRKVIGKNTKDSMNSAAIYGTASMIDGMIKKIERELGYTTIKLATGGLVELIAPYCETPLNIDHDILLYGLYKIFLKNRGLK